MIVTDQTPGAIHYEIRGGDGSIAKFVKSFNTETKEAEVYAKIITSKVVELGSVKPSDSPYSPREAIQPKMERSHHTAIFVTKGDTTTFMPKKGEEHEAHCVAFKCHLRGYKLFDKRTNEEIK